MKFADRICPLTVNNRYTQPKAVEAIEVVSYSDSEISLSFEYDRAGEGRKITIDLTNQEAQTLVDQLKKAIEGTLWKQNQQAPILE